MGLKGRELAEVRDVVVSAFSSREFDMFLRDRLDFDREDEVAAGGFRDVVDGVLGKLVDEGREWQLIHEVALARPLRDDIQQTYRKYARAVVNASQRAAVDDNTRRAYEGLGLAPPICVQQEGIVQPGMEAASGAALQAIVAPTLLNLDVAQWRELWARRERCVCRVEIGGRPLGTGFLVGPGALLTNYHVLAPVIAGGGKASDVVFRFDYKKLANLEVSTGVEIGLDAADWLVASSSPSKGEQQGTPDAPPATGEELDFALVRLARALGDEPLSGDEPGSPARRWIEMPAMPPPIFVGMALLILQHPRTAPLQLAIDTRAVTVAGPLRVRYATNTEAGSSGSPCFDWDWNLVALHHYGDPGFGQPRYNQGIPVRAIRQWLEKSGNDGVLGGAWA